MFPPTTILHPTDFSAHSRRAFRLACVLARDYNARLVLLHVLPPAMAIYAGGLAAPVDMWADTDDAKTLLRRMEEEADGSCVESLVMEGDPAALILRTAEEMKCDLIVMGTHGRTALTRLLLGSVAEEVLRKAPCPVLTAKPILGLMQVIEESKAQEEDCIAAGVQAE